MQVFLKVTRYIVTYIAHCHAARSVAGVRLFARRRWLHPTHAPDLALLDARYDDLRARFQAFAACPREHFLQTLADVSVSWSRRLTAKGVEGRQSLADHAPVATLFRFNPAVADVDRVGIPRRATCQGRLSQSHADGASWMAMPAADSACLQDLRKMPIAEVSTAFAAGSSCTQDTQGDAVARRPSQQEQAAPASTAKPASRTRERSAAHQVLSLRGKH